MDPEHCLLFLKSHLSGTIYLLIIVTWFLNTVHDAGHRITARALYRPWDGPVEYVIHSIEQELSTRISHVTTDAQLCTEVHNIVTGLDGFDAYFVHCGY